MGFKKARLLCFLEMEMEIRGSEKYHLSLKRAATSFVTFFPYCVGFWSISCRFVVHFREKTKCGASKTELQCSELLAGKQMSCFNSVQREL